MISSRTREDGREGWWEKEIDREGESIDGGTAYQGGFAKQGIFIRNFRGQMRKSEDPLNDKPLYTEK